MLPVPRCLIVAKIKHGPTVVGTLLYQEIVVTCGDLMEDVAGTDAHGNNLVLGMTAVKREDMGLWRGLAPPLNHFF
jgi:hypothetical protein